MAYQTRREGPNRRCLQEIYGFKRVTNHSIKNRLLIKQSWQAVGRYNYLLMVAVVQFKTVITVVQTALVLLLNQQYQCPTVLLNVAEDNQIIHVSNFKSVDLNPLMVNLIINKQETV